MSRPRFLADHDLNQKIVSAVRRKEPAVEFIRVADIGLGQARDPDILEHAAREGLIVVSHDVNTMCGHAYTRIEIGQPMNGVFIVDQRDTIGPIIDDLLLIWSLTEAEEWVERVTFLPLPRSS